MNSSNLGGPKSCVLKVLFIVLFLIGLSIWVHVISYTCSSYLSPIFGHTLFMILVQFVKPPILAIISFCTSSIFYGLGLRMYTNVSVKNRVLFGTRFSCNM